MLELNTIYFEDCLTGMQKIDDKSVDMILTDLPYGSTKCKWDIIIPFDLLWNQYKRIIKNKGAIVLNASQPFTSLLITSNLNWFKYCWYWKKEKGTGFATSGKRPLNIVEDIVVFAKSSTIYNPQRKKLDKPYKHTLPNIKSDSGGKDTLYSIKKEGSRIYKYYEYDTPHNFLEFARDKSNRGIHPTQKPVALYEYLIKVYTNENQLVLDSCMGSATTAIACMNTNRNFIGFENDSKYYEIAVNRIKNHKKIQ